MKFAVLTLEKYKIHTKNVENVQVFENGGVLAAIFDGGWLK